MKKSILAVFVGLLAASSLAFADGGTGKGVDEGHGHEHHAYFSIRCLFPVGGKGGQVCQAIGRFKLKRGEGPVAADLNTPEEDGGGKFLLVRCDHETIDFGRPEAFLKGHDHDGKGKASSDLIVKGDDKAPSSGVEAQDGGPGGNFLVVFGFNPEVTNASYSAILHVGDWPFALSGSCQVQRDWVINK